MTICTKQYNKSKQCRNYYIHYNLILFIIIILITHETSVSMDIMHLMLLPWANCLYVRTWLGNLQRVSCLPGYLSVCLVASAAAPPGCSLKCAVSWLAVELHLWSQADPPAAELHCARRAQRERAPSPRSPTACSATATRETPAQTWFCPLICRE